LRFGDEHALGTDARRDVRVDRRRFDGGGIGGTPMTGPATSRMRSLPPDRVSVLVKSAWPPGAPAGTRRSGLERSAKFAARRTVPLHVDEPTISSA
jgi:hypothetical protein